MKGQTGFKGNYVIYASLNNTAENIVTMSMKD